MRGGGEGQNLEIWIHSIRRKGVTVGSKELWVDLEQIKILV